MARINCIRWYDYAVRFVLDQIESEDFIKLYHDENKFHFDEIIMMLALY